MGGSHAQIKSGDGGGISSHIGPIIAGDSMAQAQEVHKLIRPSLVYLKATAKGASGTETVVTKETTATGFLVSEDGLVLTVYHLISKLGDVVPQTVRIEARISEKNANPIRAAIVDASINTDLLLLKIPPGAKEYTKVSLGNAQSHDDDDAIYTSGFAKLISYRKQEGKIETREGPGGHLWATGLKFEYGQRGSPIYNAAGEVIGIVEGDKGTLSYMIPIGFADSLLAQVRSPVYAEERIASPVYAEERIALLVGNQAYAKEVGPLKNPINDISQVGAALKKIGFKVERLSNAGFGDLHKAVNRYVRRLRQAGDDAIGFFYYSGHGGANPDTNVNYLIPVDVQSAEEEQLWDNSIPLQRVIADLSNRASNATHFVVFDACRNELQLKKRGTKALGRRKGFQPERQHPGMLIAYATAPGELASDVGAGVGPYAKVLAEELVKPGLEAVAMFRQVQLKVDDKTGQSPWLRFPSLPEIYLAGRDDTLEKRLLEFDSLRLKMDWAGELKRTNGRPKITVAYEKLIPGDPQVDSIDLLIKPVGIRDGKKETISALKYLNQRRLGMIGKTMGVFEILGLWEKIVMLRETLGFDKISYLNVEIIPTLTDGTKQPSKTIKISYEED